MPITKPENIDNLPLAVSAIVVTVLALSLGDALIKFTSSDLVVWQIFVLRSALLLPFLFFALWYRGVALKFAVPVQVWVIIRSLMLVAMWLAYYACLPHIDLSVAAAGYYTLPIFISLFSALLIGEKIRALGWFAVGLGFVGTLMIIKPNVSDFNPHVLLPLLSAILYALAMILTRTKCRDVHPLSLSAALNVAFVVVGLIATMMIGMMPDETRSGFLMAPWSSMAAEDWLAIVLLAMAILIGSVGAAIAYQNGPPSVIGTFDFAYVAFAVTWGVLFFGNWPDGITLVGILLIVAAGIMSLRANAANRSDA